MAKYVKKPVAIEAILNTGDGFYEDPEWVKDAIASGGVLECLVSHNKGSYIIKTLEGMVLCDPVSYLIRGVRGELYPCRGDIFRETYEKVRE